MTTKTKHFYAEMLMDRLPKSTSLSKDSHISITSFNLLAEICCGKRNIKWNWQYRLEKMRHLLDKIDSDVICLQEVEGGVKFEENFKIYYESRGYECLLQKKDHFMSNAILYRKSMFSIEIEESRSRTMFVGLRRKNSDDDDVETEDENVELNTPDKPHTNKKEKSIKLTNREGLIFVACVHLEGNPIESSKRLSQMKSLLHQIQLHIGSTPIDQICLFICGDFNCNHKSNVYRFLNDGEFDSSSHGLIRHPFKLTSAYKGYENHMTYLSRGSMDHIDLIFGSTNAVEPVYILGISQQEELQSSKNLPNSQYPSDHLPVAAVFRFKNDFPLNKREKT